MGTRTRRGYLEAIGRADRVHRCHYCKADLGRSAGPILQTIFGTQFCSEHCYQAHSDYTAYLEAHRRKNPL
jgi:hypothetical protein